MAYVPPFKGMSPEEFKKRFNPTPVGAPSAPKSNPVPAPSSSNQNTYLNNLVAQGGGNAIWAKNQLQNMPKPQSPPMGGYMGGVNLQTPKSVSNPVSNPSGSVGGFNYGTDTPNRSHALDASRKVWESDPAAKAAEIARTQSIIAQRKASGEDVTAQEKHLYTTLGVPYQSTDNTPVPAPMPTPMPTPTPSPNFNYTPSPNTPQIPIPQNTNPVMDRAAIQKYVADQIAAKLAQSRSAADQSIKAGETTAQQQLGSLQTQFDRTRQTIGEDRTLQNLAMDRTLNPFSGRTSYEKGITNLQRERSDREMQQDLSTRQGNVNADLANFRNSIDAKYAALQESSGAEAERLQREILSDERQYELALRGENRSDVLANADMTNQDFRRQLDTFSANRGVYESDRDFNYGVGRDQVGDTRYTDETNYNRGRDTLGDTRYTDEVAYNRARDSIMDERDKRDFDEDVRRYGIETAIQKAQNAGIIENQRADNARAAAAANESSGGGSSSSSTISYKSNPEFAVDLQWVLNNPTARADLIQHAQEFIADYGYEGWQELMKNLPKEE